MNPPSPTFEAYDQLVPVARALYEVTSALSWKLLLPLFLLSVALSYTTELGRMPLLLGTPLALAVFSYCALWWQAVLHHRTPSLSF